VRIRAVVAYDGTGYSGFQRQANAPTIQEALEQVLEKLTTSPTRITAAGRTDAGVHACGQVIAFEPEWRHDWAQLQRGMNALLPDQIVVHALEPTEETFHPRFDARRRLYRYYVYRAPVRSPFACRYSLHVKQALDVGAMQRAAQQLVGRHDFLAFGSPPQGNNSVREVLVANWHTLSADWLVFEIQANAFLYRMVRMLVGTLLRVGTGALSVREFERVFRKRDRAKAGPAVAAEGLVLESVAYEDWASGGFGPIFDRTLIG
jgi:tRNA pseudouridine38-40 synthase